MNNLSVNDLNKINKYIKKFKNFSGYLPNMFIEDKYIEFNKTYNLDNGINPEIYFGLYIQNKINYELCKLIKEENIDLEIELIDKYMPILNYLVLRLHISDNLDKEGILIKSFETYNGLNLMSLHILNVLKNEINKTNVKEEINSNNNSNNKSFELVIDEYIKNNNLLINDLSYLDTLIIKLDIIKYIDDELLLKYVYLKFGYHNNFYFKDNDIMKILGINEDNVNLMYKKCLILLKQIMNQQIDLILKEEIDSYNKIRNYNLIEKNS